MRSLLLLVAVTACTTSASSGKFAVDGNIAGSAPPSAKVVFAWNTTQQLTKWGEGTSTNGNFTVSLDPVPPNETFIVMTGEAVGIPVLVDSGAAIADGPIDLATTPHLGIATDYAVIYKSSTVETVPTLPWVASFGASYSCAKCVRGGNGALDSWELTPCANVQIVIGAADTAVCKWN